MILVSERSYALCSSKSRTCTPRAGQVEVMFFSSLWSFTLPNSVFRGVRSASAVAVGL